jgi:hypothetical protein
MAAKSKAPLKFVGFLTAFSGYPDLNIFLDLELEECYKWIQMQAPLSTVRLHDVCGINALEL